jgi:4-alpha-glucanotransferase
VAREAGLLLHPTSLPSRFGIGDLGPQAEAFVDWAALAGQKLWQVLPLGPTGHHDSPYGSLSAFAGNPLLLSPERLVEDGFLPAAAADDPPPFDESSVDYERVGTYKEGLLRASYAHFSAHAGKPARAALEEFTRGPSQAYWLSNWTLYASLLSQHDGAIWTSFPKELVHREPWALAAARAELADEIAYHEYLQFLFFGQWSRLKAYANAKGILLFGDVPIYVAFGSADVFAHQELFALDAEGRPEKVAGVPPDYFSETGQLWGNPLYRWDAMESDGYGWWVERLRLNLSLADLVRVDHFRGFASYWEVDAREETAVNGRWVRGPGSKVFQALRAALGELPIVAEDLGVITPDVEDLLAEVGFPGMKVLQFAFHEDDSGHLPHNHLQRSVVYSGTHDNPTARGWWETLDPTARERVTEYLGHDTSGIERTLLRAAYGSVADRAIVPIQDVFGLGAEATMNVPGRAEGNWKFRAQKSLFTVETAERLARLASLTGRAGAQSGA